MNPLAEAWRGRGRVVRLCDRQIFTVDLPAQGTALLPPLLVLHGFPTSSFDFHRVVGGLAAHRRVILFDMLGFGLSEKPDVAYRLAAQADLAVALTASLEIDRLGLLTHDIGDTVGGELLARQMEGSWDVEITDRVLANGSIYIELAHLSAGQVFLLDLPDRRLDDDALVDRSTVLAGLAATLGPGAAVDDDEAGAQWEMIAHLEGHRLLPRTIRYIEERRHNEARFTTAIEEHPSPLTVVWGDDDPIAVVAMTGRLLRARPDTGLHLLDRVGHYPMIEAPDRFLDALAAASR
jgi:pimeloyl-ACP methyl ester carboxylesterase